MPALAPSGDRRMSANPHANGGVRRDLVLPDFRDYAVEVAKPGTTFSEATRVLGEFSWKIENMLNRVLDGSRPPTTAVAALLEDLRNRKALLTGRCSRCRWLAQISTLSTSI